MVKESEKYENVHCMHLNWLGGLRKDVDLRSKRNQIK